jgi:hypothetical protein
MTDTKTKVHNRYCFPLSQAKEILALAPIQLQGMREQAKELHYRVHVQDILEDYRALEDLECRLFHRSLVCWNGSSSYCLPQCQEEYNWLYDRVCDRCRAKSDKIPETSIDKPEQPSQGEPVYYGVMTDPKFINSLRESKKLYDQSKETSGQ